MLVVNYFLTKMLFFIYFLRLFHIDRINFFAIAILEFTFTLGLAAGWEIIEFTIDYLYDE